MCLYIHKSMQLEKECPTSVKPRAAEGARTIETRGQLGRQTLPSPRQLRQRCSRVVPQAGQLHCAGTAPLPPSLPGVCGRWRRRSCLSETGGRQRRMPWPAATAGCREMNISQKPLVVWSMQAAGWQQGQASTPADHRARTHADLAVHKARCLAHAAWRGGRQLHGGQGVEAKLTVTKTAFAWRQRCDCPPVLHSTSLPRR